MDKLTPNITVELGPHLRVSDDDFDASFNFVHEGIAQSGFAPLVIEPGGNVFGQRLVNEAIPHS